MKQAYGFALKWYKKFRNLNTGYKELIDIAFADDCEHLGFKIDCGHSFSSIYDSAVYDCFELEKIIDEVVDIPLLGSAIFSRWRYFNHWAYMPEDIAKENNRLWFMIALNRLAILSSKKHFSFSGKPEKITIVSKKEYTKQRLLINSNGQVQISIYSLDHKMGKYINASSRSLSIDSATAEMLLNKTASFFSGNPIIFNNKGIGWSINIINKDDKSYKNKGVFNPGCIDLAFISNLIREALDSQELYLFDGMSKPDVIDRITLDYNIEYKIRSREIPDLVTWKYSERLIIDRAKGELEHMKDIGKKGTVYSRYELPDEVEKLLDSFDSDRLFSSMLNTSDNDLGCLDSTSNYRMNIEYRRKGRYGFSGSFDKDGLPDDFDFFIKKVLAFIQFYSYGQIFNQEFYKRIMSYGKKYIYCSVKFNNGYKTYYYQTDDANINIGDYVVVPAGSDNHEAIVLVVNIEYFEKEDVPLPLEMTKHIIRKCTYEDLADRDMYDC